MATAAWPPRGPRPNRCRGPRRCPTWAGEDSLAAGGSQPGEGGCIGEGGWAGGVGLVDSWSEEGVGWGVDVG